MNETAKPKLTFLALPSGDFLFYEQEGWETYYINHVAIRKGGVCSDISGIETKKVERFSTLDGKRVDPEALEEELQKFRKFTDSDSIEWQYSGAAEDFTAFKTRMGVEEEVTWIQIPPEEIAVHAIPFNFDPAYETPLWHEDFSRATLLRFDQLAYAKALAPTIFKGSVIDVPEHSGVRYMKVDGNYLGDEYFEKPFVGTQADIAKVKENIRAYFWKHYLRLQAKNFEASIFSAKDIIEDIRLAWRLLDDVVPKAKSESNLRAAKSKLTGLETKLYAQIEAAMKGEK